ncbi:hypothetical protein ABE34_06025 [Lysinibacillus sphaericus]|nr:hypothetical protein [Lysinibacillus sphaericus]
MLHIIILFHCYLIFQQMATVEKTFVNETLNVYYQDFIRKTKVSYFCEIFSIKEIHGGNKVGKRVYPNEKIC